MRFVRNGFFPKWAWAINLLSLALYALVALIFPRAVRAVGDNLIERPGVSLLAAFLTVLALPVLFIILLVTIVGIPLAILLVPAFVALMIFGKVSFYALIGRKMTQGRLHLSICVLLGGLICLLIFTVPFFGLMLSLTISLIMAGCGITAIFGAGKRPAASAEGPPHAPPPGQSEARGAVQAKTLDTPPSAVPAFVAEVPVVAASAPPPSAVSSATPPADGPAAAPLASPPNPPLSHGIESLPMVPPPLVTGASAAAARPSAPIVPSANASMPRAGFWIRTAALIIDLILIGTALSPFLPRGIPSFVPDGIPLMMAIYGALLWKYRGSTVGGIVCGLKVVRMDDRPIDWATAIVRALGCFLSLIAVGLGFIWVAFDPERQSWHDKIAGTTVVRPPKGISLV